MDFKSEIKINATVQAGVLAPGFSVSPLTLIVKFLAVNTKLPEMAILTLKDLTAAKKFYFHAFLSVSQSTCLHKWVPMMHWFSLYSGIWWTSLKTLE